jgi:hypothetical protein
LYLIQYSNKYIHLSIDNNVDKPGLVYDSQFVAYGKYGTIIIIGVGICENN